VQEAVELIWVWSGVNLPYIALLLLRRRDVSEGWRYTHSHYIAID